MGIADVPMHTTWHYKTTTSYCDGISGGDGIASCSRYISGATKGYYVSITVEFTHQGQSYYAYKVSRLSELSRLDDAGKSLLRAAMSQLGMSARAFHRILKLARTIADLAGSENIMSSHLAEAIQYRSRSIV